MVETSGFTTLKKQKGLKDLTVVEALVLAILFSNMLQNQWL